MNRKSYVVTDLGPGDGGKGGVVHCVAKKRRAHTIVKEGGFQGNHGVSTSAGESFAFSQWGCGTFDGIPTHISDRLVVSPEGLLNEAAALRYEKGVHDPFGLLTIDQEALCATPYHGIASRAKEHARGKDPRGTIGTGAGEAFRDKQRFPELAIHVRDLSRPDLKDLLAAVRDQVLKAVDQVLEGPLLLEDLVAVQKEAALFWDDGFLDYIVRRFQEVAAQATIVDHEYLGREILSRDGVVVVERSHGILTDHFQGFHPHTSAIRTLPRFTQAMLDEAGYDGEVVNLGVHRAYTIRHGAGPMPTADPAMSEHLLPGSHKLENRYQGKVRMGPLDLVLLRYAIECCGGPEAFDGLTITWFDQIRANGEWQLCSRYAGDHDPTYFTSAGDLKVRFGEDDAQLAHQEVLGQQVKDCTPDIFVRKIPRDATPDELFELCAGVLGEELRVPVRMVSLGPTEREKVLK
jgi:adenylosuccinate synthase